MANPIAIRELPATASNLATLAAVSTERVVHSRLSIDRLVPGASVQTFEEVPANDSSVRDDQDGDGAAWAARDDLDRWTLVGAFEGDTCIGGAIVAVAPAGAWFFAPEASQAVLWDLRVDPGHRRRGIGLALLRAAVDTAKDRGCTRLAIETQDSNVPACKLYASVGAVLREIRPGAYAEHPEDAALLWQVDLRPNALGP